jgi:hypothetical protein
LLINFWLSCSYPHLFPQKKRGKEQKSKRAKEQKSNKSAADLSFSFFVFNELDRPAGLAEDRSCSNASSFP